MDENIRQEIKRLARLWHESNGIEEEFKLKCSLTGIEKMPLSWKLWKFNEKTKKMPMLKNLSNAISIAGSIASGLSEWVLATMLLRQHVHLSIVFLTVVVFSLIGGLALAFTARFIEREIQKTSFELMKLSSLA